MAVASRSGGVWRAVVAGVWLGVVAAGVSSCASDSARGELVAQSDPQIASDCGDLCAAFGIEADVRCSVSPADCEAALNNKAALIVESRDALSVHPDPGWGPSAAVTIEKFESTVDSYTESGCPQGGSEPDACAFLAASAEHHFQAISLMLAN
ncbi:hypothetical protein CPI83_30250 (plasmid) [Rhodococcus sp. H-CA8f]|uniref:hypothetical protein n=1 Tax=Rhodococcus sp. H-CA8f TaxID=1727214 RepID=UPI000BE280A9|nr:hypothetical protein [Rhodococcus sp. H-CA8f]ATI36478.1 hypothetical protein CPI83_30250 [Rhodococcus sp. H-CA8f]